MTGTEPDGPAVPPEGGADPDAAFVTALLIDLANDPDAPPSTVSALAVIAAARRAGVASLDDAAPAGAPRTGADRPGLPAHPRRRFRRGIAGKALLAAAAVAGFAVVAVPLATQNSSVTSSQDAARVAEAPSAAVPQPESAAAPAQADGQEAAPSDVSGLAEAGAAGAAAGACWPLLGSAETAALLATLPAGAYGPPQALVADCGAAPVAGAVLPGTTPGVALAVQVSTQVPGSCVAIDGCRPVAGAPPGTSTYLATDATGGAVAHAYGSGYEVSVGAATASGAGTTSGLSVDQSAEVALAVLAALS